MSAVARARRPPSPAFLDPPGYARHRPERTLLYQLVEQCHAEKLVAFSCKKRGFCPSCGGRRMAETAALLADEVLPERPLRQWVLSLPHALRFLLATNSEALTLVLGEVYRTISHHLVGKAGLTRTSGASGAVTLVQRFGSALNLNVHFHMVFLDGAYQTIGAAAPGIGPCALHAEDAVSGWHDPHRARAAGSDGAPRGAGADAADALDEVSRRVCAAQSVSGGGDAGASGPGCSAAAGV